ncbi:hypothetical protein AYO40_03695 [Planctomycetaceae bacterium SCGC AG-212-D15]|nr:hypothetical protein AYO40_03695 [Planctomycetaceae bacterium SCGC AG-212-D15]
MSWALRAQGLGKCYRVQRTTGRFQYRTLRESLVDAARAPFQKRKNAEAEAFWALRDVTFDVRAGEVIGLIGHNGAGKSTLLKILSRITSPSTGRVELFGRVGSLLEVGTGFHPELTGRENIYLNGSILGMTRAEIRRQFEAIVAFAEVEQFLDTPVKRYSSGMYVRLGFAVAAHLQPEILLVDEVLAVGDSSFQKKCLGKMKDVGRGGRTVVFVSHNMHVMSRLTQRCLLMEHGQVVLDGPTTDVIAAYLKAHGELEPEWSRPDRTGRSDVIITAVRVCTPAGATRSRFNADESFGVEISFTVERDCVAQIAFRLNNSRDGETIFTSAVSDAQHERAAEYGPGAYTARCEVPAHLLRPDTYHLLVAANNPRGPQHDLIEQVLQFEVTPIGSLVHHDHRLGTIAPLLNWDVQGATELRETPAEVRS